MLRQYNPQRFRRMALGGKVRHVGTVPVGEIVDLPERLGIRSHGKTDRIIVEGWIPRDYHAHHRDANGHWQSVRMTGGHLAQVRSLRTRRQYQLADHWLMDWS